MQLHQRRGNQIHSSPMSTLTRPRTSSPSPSMEVQFVCRQTNARGKHACQQQELERGDGGNGRTHHGKGDALCHHVQRRVIGQLDGEEARVCDGQHAIHALAAASAQERIGRERRANQGMNREPYEKSNCVPRERLDFEFRLAPRGRTGGQSRTTCAARKENAESVKTIPG